MNSLSLYQLKVQESSSFGQRLNAWYLYLAYLFLDLLCHDIVIRDGIMVSMSACHVIYGQFAGDRSSILRHGAFFSNKKQFFFSQ